MLHQFEDLLAVFSWWFVELRRINVLVVNELLDLDPLFLFFVQELILLFFLGNVEIHAHDGDE